MKTFYITTDYIELVRLLKANIRYDNDIEIKELITDKKVYVNGHVETRRKCKIKPGQVVKSGSIEIEVKRGR